MANVGHATADEHFINLGTSDVGQRFCVIRIVRAAHDGLGDFGEVDFDDRCVFRIRIALEQFRIGEPCLHRLDAASDGARIGITVGDHRFKERDIRVQILDHRRLIQRDRATRGAALGGGIGQLKGLLNL